MIRSRDQPPGDRAAFGVEEDVIFLAVRPWAAGPGRLGRMHLPSLPWQAAPTPL